MEEDFPIVFREIPTLSVFGNHHPSSASLNELKGTGVLEFYGKKPTKEDESFFLSRDSHNLIFFSYFCKIYTSINPENPTIMKKTHLIITLAAFALIACTGKQKADGNTSDSTNKEALAEESDAPPVLAVYVKGQPVFAPFNEGDILAEGKVLKQTPEKYAKFIVNGSCFDITYKEEKNKQLTNDNSYLNQYLYQTADEMKGQTFTLTDTKAIDQYMAENGDMTAEGEIIAMDFIEGIIVSADYLKGRDIVKVEPTITEDPDEPQFSPATVAQVEKAVGAKMLKNRISHLFGDNCNFGVMTTQPNDKYGIAAWVLDDGKSVTVWTDTCEVEDGQVYWSNYDPDEYGEPNVIAVTKGEKGYDIFCTHMDNDEQANYILMRQEGVKMRRVDLGGFYQHYE